MITPLYLTSAAERPALRVGVLMDGPLVPRYVAQILEDIARCSFASVQIAVVVGAPPSRGQPTFARLVQEAHGGLGRLLHGEGDPTDLVDPGPALYGVDRLKTSTANGGAPWLAADALAEIRRRELDVILRFCTATPHGEVLGAARYGVWSYRFDAGESASPMLPVPTGEARPREVILEVLGEDSTPGVALCWSSFGAQAYLFFAQYQHVAVWETTHFVIWKLHDLHERGWEHLRARAVPNSARGSHGGDPKDAPRLPTAAQVAGFVRRHTGSAIMKGLGRGRRVNEDWQLGLRRGCAPFGGTPANTSLDGFRWSAAPPGHFWADPFLMTWGGRTVVFFEDFSHEAGYASIRCAEVQDDCTIGPPVPALDVGYHLSFPLVFEEDGDLFMIPESVADGTVTLYRAAHFPCEWVPEKVLFRGNAADTVVVRQEGRYYFFTTLHDRDDRGLKTMLFVADALTGDWRLHPDSPASSDACSARCAGAVCRRNGRLFRPSQNCGPGYGHGLNLAEIVTLDEHHYEERRWCAIDPRALPFPAIGVHTYNVCGDFEAIDGCAIR